MKYYVDVNGHGTFWYKDTAMKILHKEDGPAIEASDGSKHWYINGLRHREDGPAAKYTFGTNEWWINGNRHREDGPAVEASDGSRHWYINAARHREDGPAIEAPDGDKWYLCGQKYTKEEFDEKMKPVIELTMADIEKLLGKKVKIVK